MDRRNARALRSKAALKKAFLELFQTKEPEEISVSLLCQQAHVNRSTFYAHYNYRDQLVKEVLWESVQEAFAGRAQQWSLPLENGGVQRRFIRDYLQRFLNDPTIRRFCTCRERGNYLPLLIRAHVDLTLGESGDPVKYYKAFFHNAGVLNLLLECLNSKTVISLNELVEIIHTYSKVMYAEQS